MKLYLPVALAGLLSIASALANEDTHITKSQFLVQTSMAAPSVAATNGFGFESLLALFAPTIEKITDPQLKLPSGGSLPLYLDPDGFSLSIRSTYDSQAELDVAFPAGNYAFSGTDSIVGAFNTSIALQATAFPTAPQIVNFTDAQAVDATRDFELKWGAFAGADPHQDLIVLQLYDEHGSYPMSISPSESMMTISVGSLEPGKTYYGNLRFVKVVGANPTSYPFYPKAAFASETRFTLVTRPDTTRPRLTRSWPASGSTFGPIESFDFYFNEPMDQTKTGVGWSATLNGQPYPLDPARFTYLWMSEGRWLSVYYAPASGHWPPELTLTWHLRPDPNATNAFRDLAGNVLHADYTGSLHTPMCTGEDFVQEANFGVLKRGDHLQTGPGAATETPAIGGATFSAFLGKAGQSTTLNPSVTLEFPAPPAPLPRKLAILSQAAPGVSTLTQTFATTDELDAAFPATTYALQFRNFQNPEDQQVTSSVVFDLGIGGYPPIPHFANFADAQAINAAADFTLSWDAFAGADASSAIALSVKNANGQELLVMSHTCGGLVSFTIPATTLKAGMNHTVTLTFTQVSEQDKTMPNVAGKGVAAFASSTQMTLKTLRGVTVSTPVFRSITPAGAGLFNVVVDCSVGASLTFQVSPSLETPAFVNVFTTNAPYTPLTVTLPLSGSAHAFIRAVAN